MVKMKNFNKISLIFPKRSHGHSCDRDRFSAFFFKIIRKVQILYEFDSIGLGCQRS